jgi:hypothetical protein
MTIQNIKENLAVMSGQIRDIVRSYGKQKIFCIGRNKTGTTSLAVALRELGYVVGDQVRAEYFLPDWGRRDFSRIVRYCYSAQAFQDIPFSLPYTFQAVDMHFPGSKFILTVRDTPEQWYESLIKFHSNAKGLGKERMASLTALKEVTYRYKGFAYDARVLVHDCIEDDPYNKQILIDHYNFHNQMVRDYFRNRPQDLLILNVAEKGAYPKLCNFLGRLCAKEEFPWENKTKPQREG